jgi:hypothetical protein
MRPWEERNHHEKAASRQGYNFSSCDATGRSISLHLSAIPSLSLVLLCSRLLWWSSCLPLSVRMAGTTGQS